jgi:hypothetical protein
VRFLSILGNTLLRFRTIVHPLDRCQAPMAPPDAGRLMYELLNDQGCRWEWTEGRSQLFSQIQYVAKYQCESGPHGSSLALPSKVTTVPGLLKALWALGKQKVPHQRAA